MVATGRQPARRIRHASADAAVNQQGGEPQGTGGAGEVDQHTGQGRTESAGGTFGDDGERLTSVLGLAGGEGDVGQQRVLGGAGRSVRGADDRHRGHQQPQRRWTGHSEELGRGRGDQISAGGDPRKRDAVEQRPGQPLHEHVRQGVAQRHRAGLGQGSGSDDQPRGGE